jgi:multiple sugar transport system substrate-binding protein
LPSTTSDVLCRSLLYGLTVVIALWPGCSSDTRDEVVFVALGAEGEHVAELMPEFERRNPGIHVRVQMIPWNAAHEKLLTAYAGQSLPDMTQLGNTWIPEFHLLGALEDVTPYLKHSSTVQPSSFFSGVWDTNVLDSTVYGIPWYVDTRVLFYRTDIMAQAGYTSPPTSWKEWFDASRKIREIGKPLDHYAILLPTNNEWAPLVIMGMETGSTLLKDNNTRGNFSGPKFRVAFREFYRFFSEGLAPTKTTQIINVYQGFGDGDFAMFITGPWDVENFRRRLPDQLQDAWMTTPMPGPEGGIGVSLAGGSSLVMMSSSKHKAEVWKIIEYLSEPEVQKKFYHSTTDLPARVEAWEDSSLVNNRYAAAFYTQLNHVVAAPKIPEWEQIAQKVREYGEIVSRGVMTVDDGTAALDRDVDRMLEKRRWMFHEH